MIAELDSATNLLQEALRRYREACSSIQKSYLESQTLASIPPELSSRLTKELPLILSYEAKIKEAKSAVSWARNCSPSIVPINVLPAEVITRIFELFIETNPCIVGSQTKGYSEDAEISFPNSKNPIILSHVCSHWRDIALSARSIWTHIDLSPYPPISAKLAARAEAYAERAGQLPLDVHIVDPTAYGGLPSDGRLIQVLASIAGRINSLKINTRHTTGSGDFCRTLFQTCFAFCTPGILKQVTLESDSPSPRSYLIQPIDDPVDNPRMNDGILLDLPRDTIDTLLLSVPVLELNRIFPFWESKAYHDLTELRLGGKSGFIPESTVLAILKSSPHLRVLKFDLNMDTDFTIDNHPPELVPISPAPLKDLEILIVGSVYENSLARFLRLVAPGPKPLNLTLHRATETLHFAHPEIRKFFSRSNVGGLCASRFSGLEQVSELLSLAPNAQVLALHHFSAELQYDSEGEEVETTFTLPDTNVRLGTLYLLDCGKYDPCYIEDFLDLIETYHIQEVVAWRYYGGLRVSESLAKVCPSVTVIPDEHPNPVEIWL